MLRVDLFEGNDDVIRKTPTRKGTRSRLDDVFILANQDRSLFGSEIQRIEESFGGTKQLMSKLTMLDFDSFEDPNKKGFSLNIDEKKIGNFE